MFGSLERFIAVLIEHHAGNLPLWLAPIQVKVLTITSDADDYARQIAEKLQAANINTEVDLRNEKISYKVREHSLAKIPVLMAVGAREVKEKSVSIRRLGTKDQTTMNLDDAIKELKREIQNNPKM